MSKKLMNEYIHIIVILVKNGSIVMIEWNEVDNYKYYHTVKNYYSTYAHIMCKSFRRYYFSLIIFVWIRIKKWIL